MRSVEIVAHIVNFSLLWTEARSQPPDHQGKDLILCSALGAVLARSIAEL